MRRARIRSVRFAVAAGLAVLLLASGDANSVLGQNVRLGPWIHIGSDVRHHSVLEDGDAVEARAVVTREWERKGHRFVELDVGLVANGDRLVARIIHTAIYRPREPAPI